jgi:paraquat-inducible protein B
MEKSNPSVPEAKIIPKKHGRVSMIWVIPIVAALVGTWIAVNTIRNQGPTITIVFKSADGLEAHKTKVRYNGIEVGEIATIRISEDLKSVIATAKMNPKTDEFLKKDTEFWVVRPQISGASISGLSTLISGAYVGVDVGKSKESERHFKALEDAPLEVGGITGHYFMLQTPQLDSINKGTPIFYRRLQAGQVADYELDKSGQFLNVKIFLQAPYDQFVTTDTRFWQASGVDMSLSASGLRVRTESLLSILIGGIAFETPADDGVPAAPAGTNTMFALHKDREAAFRPPPADPQSFKLMFKESLRGLEVGAPVTLSGITIGEVTAIHAQFDAESHDFIAPVTIEVDPERYGVDFLNTPGDDTQRSAAAHKATLESFVKRGLRAQLKTGSLVTGSRYIALEFFQDAVPVTLDWSQKPLKFPTQPGSLDSIEASVVGIIKKVNQIPFSEIGTNLNKTIGSLDQTLAGAQGSLTNANRLLNNAGQFIAPGSVFDAQLNNTLQQFGGAAQALRILADYLERHPEALIHGKSGDAK